MTVAQLRALRRGRGLFAAFDEDGTPVIDTVVAINQDDGTFEVPEGVAGKDWSLHVIAGFAQVTVVYGGDAFSPYSGYSRTVKGAMEYSLMPESGIIARCIPLNIGEYFVETKHGRLRYWVVTDKGWKEISADEMPYRPVSLPV